MYLTMYHDAGQFAGQIILFAEANRLVWLATVVDSLSSRVNTPSPFMVGACFAAFYWLFKMRPHGLLVLCLPWPPFGSLS